MKSILKCFLSRFILLWAVFMLFVSCAVVSDDIGEKESMSEGTLTGDYASDESGADSEGSGSQNEITNIAGQLTAGRWSDLNHWDLWTNLVLTNWSNYSENWKMTPVHRITLQISNTNGGIGRLRAQLQDSQGNPLWSARTAENGTAELFYRVFSEQDRNPEILKVYDSNQIELFSTNIEGLSEISVQLSISKNDLKRLDLMFMIDTTGSMGDELEYLKTEIRDVVERVRESNANSSVRISCNFYRDDGDDYIVRPYAFTESIENVMIQISDESADGGGDYPEAVDDALSNAVFDHQWRAEAESKLLFLVLDAPPHQEDENIQLLRHSVTNLASEGIRVIPVASSGVDTDTEYLLRSISVMTSGIYVFLTDDSGIGGEHLDPTIGQYRVEYLNDLLVSLILSSLQDGYLSGDIRQ